MTIPKTTPIISTECQNDAKAKTFATFALPLALFGWEEKGSSGCVKRRGNSKEPKVVSEPDM